MDDGVYQRSVKISFGQQRQPKIISYNYIPFPILICYLNCLLCNEIHCLVNSKNLCYMK